MRADCLINYNKDGRNNQVLINKKTRSKNRPGVYLTNVEFILKQNTPLSYLDQLNLESQSFARERMIGVERDIVAVDFSDHHVERPPVGLLHLELLAHGGGLGHRYVNDLRRHFGAGASEPLAG